MSQIVPDQSGAGIAKEAEGCKSMHRSAKSFPLDDMKGEVPEIVSFHFWSLFVSFVCSVDYPSDGLCNENSRWMRGERKNS